MFFSSFRNALKRYFFYFLKFVFDNSHQNDSRISKKIIKKLKKSEFFKSIIES
jgi:hypothetical protein